MLDINKIAKFKTELVQTEDAIIVEGINDKEQLSFFGIENIFDISGNPLHLIVEKIKNHNINSVTILTDFDEEGEKYATTLEKMLQHNDIKINSQGRHDFRNLFKVRHIEDIKPFTKLITSPLMEESFNGQISSIYNKISNRSRVLSRRGRRET